jgi:hypothetical protein
VKSIRIDILLRIAGLAQLTLVAGSFAIPRVLNWRNELVKVQPLIKQMFWTYAAYILVINLCLGLLSLRCYKELLNGSTLSLLVSGFIALYWISRVLIQFFYFDRTNFPAGKWNRLAELLLVVLFIFLSIVYTLACYCNYKHN